MALPDIRRSYRGLLNALGGFSGDGGAAQDDSVKASLDLAHTDLDTIIARIAGASVNTVLGTRVQRATAALPASTAEALFTIATGNVLVTALYGEVTTIIQNQANNTKITVNPTTGTSADIAAALDIANDEAGTLYVVEGDGSALGGGTAGTGFGAIGSFTPFIVPVGTIDLDCAATNTGSIAWTCHYVPLDDSATVTAA